MMHTLFVSPPSTAVSCTKKPRKTDERLIPVFGFWRCAWRNQSRDPNSGIIILLLWQSASRQLSDSSARDQRSNLTYPPSNPVLSFLTINCGNKMLRSLGFVTSIWDSIFHFQLVWACCWPCSLGNRSLWTLGLRITGLLSGQRPEQMIRKEQIFPHKVELNKLRKMYNDNQNCKTVRRMHCSIRSGKKSVEISLKKAFSKRLDCIWKPSCQRWHDRKQ